MGLITRSSTGVFVGSGVATAVCAPEGAVVAEVAALVHPVNTIETSIASATVKTRNLFFIAYSSFLL